MGRTAIEARGAATAPRAGQGRRGCFDAAVQANLIDLSRAFIFALLDGMGRRYVRLFLPDAAFIGGLFGEDRGGIDAFLRFCDAIERRDLRIILAHPTTVAHPLGWDECLVMSDSHLFLSEGHASKPAVSKPLRLVFDWRFVADEPRIKYLEVSFPLVRSELPASIAPDGGRTGGDGPVASMAEVFEERLVELHDVNRKTLFLGTDDILYIEADGRRSRVHLQDETFTVSESIGAIEGLLASGDDGTLPFIRVHRTYLVNAWHLRSLSAEGATLDDGSVVPVSARRLGQIRTELRGLHRPRSLSVDKIVRAMRRALVLEEG